MRIEYGASIGWRVASDTSEKAVCLKATYAARIRMSFIKQVKKQADKVIQLWGGQKHVMFHPYQERSITGKG